MSKHPYRAARLTLLWLLAAVGGAPALTPPHRTQAGATPAQAAPTATAPGSSAPAQATPKPPADEPAPARFAVVGDTGSGDASQLLVARRMREAYDERPYSCVFMLGDNLYLGSCAKLKTVFDVPYAELLAHGVKFYATLGNHDQACADAETNYPALNMGGKRFYSVAPFGDLAEFFTIDSTVLHEGRMLDQLDWLDKALAASKARWKIAFFHHPPFSPGSRHGDDPVMVAKVLPILARHGVRIVMTGHEHFFAKMKPRAGIDFIISGSGGKIQRKAIDHAYPDLTSGNDELHQFLVVSLTPNSFDYSVIAETGAILFRESIPFVRSAVPAVAP